MDMRTGEIMELSDDLKKELGLKELTSPEYRKMIPISKDRRPGELELSRYLEGKSYGTMEKLRIKQAFLAGYQLGKENNSKENR